MILSIRDYVIGGLILFSGGQWAYSLHLRHEAQAAKAQVHTATVQAETNKAAADVADHYHTKTIVIRERADAAEKAVQAAPSAGQPLPVDVLDAWRASLTRMRDTASKPDPAYPR